MRTKEIYEMARNQRHYDTDYKLQAVALAKENGLSKTARELGVSTSTLNGWIQASKKARLIPNSTTKQPGDAMTLEEEVAMLRKQVKDQDKEIKRLKKENDFLEEASAFFAASRLRSAKTHD